MYDHTAYVTKFTLYIPHDPELSTLYMNGIGNQGPKFLYSDRLVLVSALCAHFPATKLNDALCVNPSCT